jgi:hypothetical protein
LVHQRALYSANHPQPFNPQGQRHKRMTLS